MMQLVVNADDFGKSQIVTMAIVEAFSRGYITQTTLMVNMPFADRAVDLARQNGVFDNIGLHLNLTEGVPLTNEIRECSDLCDENGAFISNAVGDRPLPASLIAPLKKEICAQIEKYMSYGLPLMHCDGHHHVHNREFIAPIVLDLLKGYGFKSVRNRYSLITKYGPMPKMLSLLTPIRENGCKNICFERTARKLGLRFTAGFGALSDRNLRYCHRFKSFEFMVHPGYNQNGKLVDVQDWELNDGPELKVITSLEGMK